MKQRVYNLLKTWCDSICTYQIREIKDPNLYGGILCPACGTIHGRCSDAVYPLMYMYSQIENEKYLKCAELTVQWAEHNLVEADGSYRNDFSNLWNGITTFGQIALGETLLRFSNLLPKETYRQWLSIFVRQTDYMYHISEDVTEHFHINYICSWAYSMAVAHELLMDGKYRERAEYWFAKAIECVSDDGLLYGESKNRKEGTSRGRYSVDIGYNAEESLPALLLTAKLLQDRDKISAVEALIRTQLEFMLPDGAWDNSMGTRNGKWTYWGSRTSDGCQTAFLQSEDEVIREAAIRNYELYEKCSSEGLLYGGLMYVSAGEPACIHHTFCHAKALTAMCLAEGWDEPRQRKMLPREEAYRCKRFESMGTTLVAVGQWRASLCDNDCSIYEEANPFGAAMTMLYHMQNGPVLAASLTKYQMIEPTNFQVKRHERTDRCTTPHIECGHYSSLHDREAMLDGLHGKGALTDNLGNKGPAYSVEYLFAEHVEIRVKCERDSQYVLPLIHGCNCEIISDARMEKEEDFFSLVGGFLFTPYVFEIPSGQEIRIIIAPQR